MSKLHQAGLTATEVQEVLEALSDIELVPFTQEQAEAAARLSVSTRRLGLSLGDRACLVVAAMRGAAALTADRAWANLDPTYDVRLIR